MHEIIIRVHICMSFFLLCCTCNGSDVTYYHVWEKTGDTTNVITMSPSPTYLNKCELIIKHPIDQDYEGVIVCHPANNDGACFFEWESTESIAEGHWKAGDTAVFQFSVTPVSVGEVAVLFDLDYGGNGVRIERARLALAIDQSGIYNGDFASGAVDNAAKFGLLPESLKDSLVIVMGCPICARRDYPTIFASVVVKPPFGRDQWSEVRIKATPSHQMDFGVFYKLNHSENFEISYDSTEWSDWDNSIGLSDTLRVRFLARPTAPGIGCVSIRFDGFLLPGSVQGSYYYGDGIVEKSFSITAAIDSSLSLVAFSARPFMYAKGTHAYEGMSWSNKDRRFHQLLTLPWFPVTSSGTRFSPNYLRRVPEIRRQLNIR